MPDNGARARYAGLPPLAVWFAMLVALYEWAVYASSYFAPGSIGIDYQGVGTDWMVFHSAARQVIEQDLASLYDGAASTARLNRDYAAHLFSPLEFRPWVNPPWFAVALVPFGALPVMWAYALFMALQAAVLALVLRGCAKAGGLAPAGKWIGIALLSPAMAVTLASGQTAPLAAALALLALRERSARPWLAGLALALLTYKPQFVPLLGLYLLASREWRTLGWATLFGLLLVGGSMLATGVQPWLDWIVTVTGGISGQGQWADAGRLWGNSLFAALAAAGLPQSMAATAQNVLFIGLVALACLIPFRLRPGAPRHALILVLVLLAAPHSASYDVLFAIAALLWVALAGAVPQERVRTGALLALGVWLIPVFSPPILNPVGIGIPALLGLLALWLWRVAGAKGSAQ